VRNVKGIGAGENYREVREYEVDVALLRELRAHEEQAARELGQWVDKVAPTSPDGGESYAPFSDDERAAVLRAALARLGVAVDEPGAVRAALALGPPVAGAGPGDDGGGHDPGPLAGQAPPL
jgi:class 3 adenylate cyclase